MCLCFLLFRFDFHALSWIVLIFEVVIFLKCYEDFWFDCNIEPGFSGLVKHFVSHLLHCFEGRCVESVGGYKSKLGCNFISISFLSEKIFFMTSLALLNRLLNYRSSNSNYKLIYCRKSMLFFFRFFFASFFYEMMFRVLCWKPIYFSAYEGTL